MQNKIIESTACILQTPEGEVKLIINFLDEFGIREYKDYLDSFLSIHSTKGKKDLFESRELQKIPKINKNVIRKKGTPDFDYFKKTSALFLQRIIGEVLNQMPELIELSTKPREICIDIISSEKHDYYAYHEEKKSGPSKTVIELSGGLLVGRVVAPKYYIGRSSYRFVEKLLLHEFRHQVELLRGVYKREFEQYEKLRSMMLKKYKSSNIGRLSLHTVLCNLMSEGLAEYYVMRRATKVEINMDWIREFRNQLKKLVLIQNEKEALEYMQKKLDEERGPSVYYCGKIMCYLIGLAAAKKKSETSEIKIHANKQLLEISKINEAMNASKRFHIDKLSQKSFRRAVKKLNKVYYYKNFIKKYETACKELGIEEKNMIIHKNLLVDIRKESKENFTKLLSAGLPRQTSRLQRLKEKIKHFFSKKEIQQNLPAGPQKQQ